MSRTLFLAGVAAATFLLTPAFAAQAAVACTSTYASALLTDALTNGPVHDQGGTITVGGFTPTGAATGAVAPTQAYVGCMV